MLEPRPETAASIVIPAYNHAAYIEECLASALAQGGGIEVVLVDDGSTDDTRQRAERFLGDPRLRIYSQENRGAHAALNRGISLACGEVVFLLNSDDAFAPRRVERFLERFAAEPGLTVLTSWLEVIGPGGEPLGIKQAYRNMPPWPRPRPGPGLAATGRPALALLEANFVATTTNVAFRRRLFTEGLRFLPLRYAHDWEFLLAACHHGGLGIVEEPLARYRVHPENTLAEGRRDAGRGLMRYEILWLLARHAAALCRRFAAPDAGIEELRRRLWNSLPRFGREDLLGQLLYLRGDEELPPALFDQLIAAGHPLRDAAVQSLALSEDAS